MTIKYGYFRHRFDAHTNPKLNKFMDKYGLAGYGYYFTLIELYGQRYSTKKQNEKVVLHIRSIANLWRKQPKSCIKVLTFMEQSGIIVCTFMQNSCELTIPNFLDYYGSYKKTNTEKLSNKSKVNKSKVKDISCASDEALNSNPNKKEKVLANQKQKRDNKNTHEELIKKIMEYFNERTGKNYKPTSKETVKHINARINEGYKLEQFKSVVDVKCDEWQNDYKMAPFLRPKTIFGTKFEDYLNQANVSPKTNSQQWAECLSKLDEIPEGENIPQDVLDIRNDLKGKLDASEKP